MICPSESFHCRNFCPTLLKIGKSAVSPSFCCQTYLKTSGMLMKKSPKILASTCWEFFLLSCTENICGDPKMALLENHRFFFEQKPSIICTESPQKDRTVCPGRWDFQGPTKAPGARQDRGCHPGSRQRDPRPHPGTGIKNPEKSDPNRKRFPFFDRIYAQKMLNPMIK